MKTSLKNKQLKKEIQKYQTFRSPELLEDRINCIHNIYNLGHHEIAEALQINLIGEQEENLMQFVGSLGIEN